jgi:hypothetical protein
VYFLPMVLVTLGVDDYDWDSLSIYFCFLLSYLNISSLEDISSSNNVYSNIYYYSLS